MKRFSIFMVCCAAAECAGSRQVMSEAYEPSREERRAEAGAERRAGFVFFPNEFNAPKNTYNASVWRR